MLLQRMEKTNIKALHIDIHNIILVNDNSAFCNVHCFQADVMQLHARCSTAHLLVDAITFVLKFLKVKS